MHRSRSNTPRFARFILHAVILLAATLAARPCFGQGTMGTVPDPISSRDLVNYGDRLGLSDQQRQAIESLHEQYREEFRVLRETDIEKYLQQSRGWQGFGMTASRKEVEDQLRDLENVLSKVKTTDNRFFDQVQGLLTEEQVVLMQSVRQARERSRYRTGFSRMAGFFNPATRIDLGELLSDLPLSLEELQNVSAIISQYESTLTSAAHKLHDDSISMMRDTVAKMAAMGFNDQNSGDGGRRREMWEAMRPIMSENSLKIMEQAAQVSDLNRRTLRSVTPLLDSQHARMLADEFLQIGYPEIAGRGQNTRRAFEVALKFDDLNQEQRETITVMAAEYSAAADRLAEQAMDLIDANRKTQTMFDFDMEKRRKHEAELGELREKRNKSSETALTSLKATIGPELTERLEKRVAQGEKEGEEVTAQISIVGAPGGAAGVAAVTFRAAVSAEIDPAAGADRFIPGPISQRDLDRYSQLLKLQDEIRSVVASLREDYLEQFKTIEETQISKVRELQQNQWSTGPNGMTPPTSEQIAELYSARRAAVAAIMALDGTFFDDLELTLGDDSKIAAVQRLRQARQRDIYALGVQASDAMRPGRELRRGGRGGGGGGGGGQRGGAMRFFGGGAGEQPLDLVDIIQDAQLTPSDAAAFEQNIADYENTVTALFQKVYEGSLRAQQAFDNFGAEIARNNAGGERRSEREGGNLRESIESDSRASREARREVTALNRTTLDSLLALLPDQQAADLKRAYQRKAFADVFVDERSAEPHLLAANELPDLTAEQRGKVQEIAIEFRVIYDEICQKMVDLEAAAPQPVQRDNFDPRNMQDQLRNREKLHFERNDLNDKAIAQLRAALTPEQVQRLGGLEFEGE